MPVTRRLKVDMTDIYQYNAAAGAAAATVIGQYSTSFGLATRMLGPSVRCDVTNIYALVRIADEIVDGAAAGAGVDVDAQAELLAGLERETMTALGSGYSTNLVVHAFADTARRTGINELLIAPFFASMRRDLSPEPFTPEGVDEYIYGSAEVIGLMCLRAFLADSPRSVSEVVELELGARRLGAAFQKINFLRDLASDSEFLGRNYFPGIDPARITEADKAAVLDDIDLDLAVAERALPLLPRSSRTAVTAAHHLFARLSAKLRATPAEDLLKSRVRVADAEKLAILAGVTLGPGAWKR